MQLVERLIGVDEPAAWDAALSTIDHVYWQRWAPCFAASLSSGLPTHLYVCADEAGVTQAACPFSVREWAGTSDIFTPTGFGGFTARGDVPALRAQWDAFAAREGYVCGYLALHPLLHAEGMHRELHDANDLFFLDLSHGPDAIRAVARIQLRKAIREWDAAGTAYVVSRDAVAAFIHEHYHPFMTAAGANPAAMWSPEGLTVLCDDPASLLVGVADGQGVCSAVLFGRASTSAELVISLSVRDGRRHTRSLMWWGIKALSAQGVPWLSLGGGIRRGDELARAKRTYRPVVLPLLGAREVYEPAVYGRLCADAGVDPGIEGFFPPYRQRPRATSAESRPATI